MPRSWRHYQYGLAYLGRAHMRDQIAYGEAARLAGTGGKHFEEWRRDLTTRLTPRLPE